MQSSDFYYVDFSDLENFERIQQKNLPPFPEGEEDSQTPLFPEDELLLYPELSESFELELDYFDAEKQDEKIWQARTGLNQETLCAAIETIVFMSDRPASLTKIRKHIDEEIPLRALHEAIERLQSEYEQKHHGLRLMEVAEGYQFRTKATYSKYVQDIFNVNSLVLTPTALEVLAVIAYKQPVPKPEVDKIRGVDSSHIVRGLMDKRLVKVVGRSEDLGRPVLYGTTPEFLEVFNLADLSQLPPEHELEQMAEDSIGKVSDIKGLVHSGDKSRFKFDEMDELDELSSMIKSIKPETEFTKSVRFEEKRRVDESGAEVKTAFDLLEEYLDRQEISDANRDSLKSELFTAVTSPLIIDDLSQGPFNLPEEDEDGEFQMIDLDTGEVIGDSLQKEDDQEVVDLADLEQEKQELADALDSAFEKIMSQGQSDALKDDSELIEEHDEFNEKAEEIEQWGQDAIKKARELDIDLNFLNDESDKNTDNP